jgi:hypothetical protein
MNDADNISVVDCIVLSRSDAALHPDVAAGIAGQRGVRLIVHRVIGRRRDATETRMPAIARARNEGKRRGESAWLMFLDDDVVLEPDCSQLLLDGLRAQPDFAALGADYLGQSGGRVNCEHVAMGATLFRRRALHPIQFRWAQDQCECLCCCTDLRRMRWGIGYLPQARARHIPSAPAGDVHEPKDAHQRNERPRESQAGELVPAYVFASFDRRHLRKFRLRFLASLRKAGNQEPVFAFAYDLYRSEQREVARLRGVELIPLRSNGVAVPISRLLDFQGPLERLPPQSVVAYWDAGDVVFQDRLTELWTLARQNADRLLVVEEPFRHPENPVVALWTLSIHDRAAARSAFELLAPSAVLNGGFAAGTVQPILHYFQSAHQLLHSKAMRGTTDWGDQTAMNLYCHGNPDRFLPVDERWNFCLAGRRRGDVQLTADGRFARSDGGAISAVHGNGHSFHRYAFFAPAAMARCCGTTELLV